MIDEHKKKFEDTTIICFIKTQNYIGDEIDIHVCLKIFNVRIRFGADIYFSLPQRGSNRTDTFDSQQRQIAKPYVLVAGPYNLNLVSLVLIMALQCDFFMIKKYSCDWLLFRINLPEFHTRRTSIQIIHIH